MSPTYVCVCVFLFFEVPNEARILSFKMEEMRLNVFYNVRTESTQYRFDLWDFGGQLIYYTAHQTFFSPRAIYLLTVDMSERLDEELLTQIEPPEWKESGSPKTRQGTSL